MSSYGRNFDFRVVPKEEQRKGRVILSAAADVPIGAPLVIAAGAVPDAAYTGALPTALATGATAFRHGFCGLGIYEHLNFDQSDPLWTLYSDKDLMPAGKQVQFIVGPNVKVVFKNTTAHTFLGSRSYPGRVMVAGMGATPTLAVGDFLTPGVGNDTSGYWAETATAANAWLVVTNVDVLRQEVEAELLV